MPNVLRIDGWRFFFYSNEGDPREPAHVHVRHGPAEAKFWLEPSVALAECDGVDARTLRELTHQVHKHRVQLLRSWYEYFA